MTTLIQKRRTSAAITLLLLFLLPALILTVAVQAQEGSGSGSLDGYGPMGDDGPQPDELLVLEQTVIPTGVNSVYQIPASKDTFLSSSNPGTNYGNLNLLRLGWNSTYGAMRTVIQFDLSSIPQNAFINSAQLRIYQTSASPSNDSPMGTKAQFMRSSWSEGGATWNNANYLGGAEIGVGEINNLNGWKSADATEPVREHVSGAVANNGFILIGAEGTENGGRSRTFYSRQQPGFQPVLIVDWVANCDTTKPTASVNALPQYSPAEFTVTWSGSDSAPSGCPPSGVAYYNVQYNINGGNWADWKTRVTNTSGTFKGAQNGQLYQFRAQAVDNAGNVQDWTGAQTQTRIDTIAPTSSVNALPQYAPSPNFPVSWSGSDNAGGSGIATYDVQFQVDEGNWQDWLVGFSGTSATFTGGQDQTEYGFRVRATDRAGNVESYPNNAEAVTVVVLAPYATVTPIATPPIINDPSATSFNVSWVGFTAPSTTIVKYELRWRFNTGAWQNYSLPSPTTNSIVFDIPNANDGTYGFEVRAINSIGQQQQFTGQPQQFVMVDRQAPFIERAQFQPIILDSTQSP